MNRRLEFPQKLRRLLELHNGGVQIVLYSPKWQYSNKNWEIKLQKSEEGINLEIVHQGSDLEETIEEAYVKWIQITEKGAPELTLRQIEHVPALGGDDEDPF